MRNNRLLEKHVLRGVSAAALLAAATSAVAAPDEGKVTVLNWWTSGSEAKSMQVLERMLADQGYNMVNEAVSGGGGSNARTVLKSRIQSNNVPGAAQIKGPEIQQWCNAGLAMRIDQVAEQQNWQEILPGPIAQGMQCDGHFVAVPFNVHRINWVWVNKAALDKAGAEMPTDWDSLVSALDKLQQAGITPIAGGGDTWQVATEFDAIALATGGAEFYRKAFIELDQDTLSSDTMAEALSRLRTLQQYVDRDAQGLSWNRNTGEVVKGNAGMQIMGDWAKGELTNAGATPGDEIACIAFPGEHEGFVYNADSFEMLTSQTSDKPAQYAFAETALSPEFQRQFNLAKGSIPVRQGVSLEGFDTCAQKSAEAFQAALDNNTLVPSYSQDMAQNGAVKGALFDVIAKFYNDQSMSPEAAAQQMAQQAQQAQLMSQL